MRWAVCSMHRRPFSRKEFTAYTRQLLSRTRGVQALAWNPNVFREQLTDIKRLARQEGMKDYDFFQQKRG